MKQVYAAGPLTATNTGTLPTATIQATSAGTSSDVLTGVLPLASYQSQSLDLSHQPVRLSLVRTATTGRVLSHVAPNGGTYFSHLLLDVPLTTDAQTAIQTWGSPQWQRHESDTQADLPELPFLPVSDRLDDATLKSWLADSTCRDLLEFTIAAMLTVGATGRIILNAKSDDVAMIVYAVTRAFPSSLTDDLTFSTYETEPLNCSARIIGCDRTLTDWELPEGCYENGNLAFNPASGRKSQLHREIGFAAFAVNALATGDLAALDEFRATWQRLGLADDSQFDLIDRLDRGTGTLNRDEMTTALQSPAVALWVSARKDAVAQLTEWALDDRTFATGPFARVVQAMRPRAECVTGLAESVRQSGFEAVKGGDVIRAGNAFDVILPMVAPAKAQAVWADVQKLNPMDLTWETRWKLLPRLVRNAQQRSISASPADLSNWLDLPSEKLSEFLSLDLPKPYLLFAARADRPTDELPVVAKAIAPHPAIAMAAVQPTQDCDHDRAAKLFETLVVNEPARNWFEEVVKCSSDYPSKLLNRFFETELEKGQIDADRLIRTNGSTLLNLFSGQSGLETIGSRFLSTPPADLLHQKGILDFLGQLKSQGGGDLTLRIAAVQTVREFLDQPHCEGTGLTALSAALELQPSPLPTTAKTETFRALATELGRRVDSAEFQSDFETVIRALGPTIAKGPTDLFQDLLRELRGQPGFANHVNAVSASLAIALGAIKSDGLTLDGLEPDAFALATDAAKIGKLKLLDELDARTNVWPKEAKAKWGFLKEAVRPPSSRIGRDLLCFAAGALCVGFAWGIWLIIRNMNS